MKLARLAANPMMLTLNSICSDLNLLRGLGRLCSTVDRHAIAVAAAALRLIAAINKNGRLTDMFPEMPGSLTFILEVAAANASSAAAWTECKEWLCSPVYLALAAAASTINPIKICVSRVLRFMNAL